MNIGKVTKRLESIRITGDFTYLKMTSILQANQKSLKEFQFQTYSFTESDAIILFQSDHLESLCISLHCPVISNQIFYMISLLNHLRSLHLQVNLLECKHINLEDLANILCHPNLTKLESLRLSYKAKKNQNNKILTAIASLKHLKELYFNPEFYFYPAFGIGQKGNSYQGLFMILHGCSQLEKIVLHFNIKFQNDKFKNIFTMDLPSLKVLGMQHDDYVGLDQNYIVECMNHSKSLKLVGLDTILFYRQKSPSTSIKKFTQFDTLKINSIHDILNFQL